MTPHLCAELAAIRPLTLAGALDEYAATVHAMTDEQLLREVARVEALPGSGFRQRANDEVELRDRLRWLAFVDSFRPVGRWGCS